MSVDSIDSRASPQLEHHRRSKSILKKADSSAHRNGRVDDPESERLISDGQSFGMPTSVDCSPDKRPPPSSPSLTRRSATRRALVKTLPLKQPSDPESRSKGLRSPLALLDDILGDRKKDRSAGCRAPPDVSGELPLYICPPPPPMDDHSPTEETRLLLHQTPLPQHRQMPNSTAKGANQIS